MHNLAFLLLTHKMRERSGQAEEQPKKDLSWTYGRAIIIRPDVPGKRFHPEDTHLITTPKRQAAAEWAIKETFAEIEAQGNDRPTWDQNPQDNEKSQEITTSEE